MASCVLKQRLALLLDFLLPLADLHRVDAVFLADLIDRLDASHRLQSDLRLELRKVDFALLRFTHDLPISFDSVLLKLLSQIWGPL